MKRFMISTAVATMILGGAGLAMAQTDSPGPDRGAAPGATQMPSATEVQTLLQSKGYNQVSAVQTGNPDGKVKARAMKDGKPVNLEIDMNTGGIVEVK